MVALPMAEPSMARAYGHGPLWKWTQGVLYGWRRFLVRELSCAAKQKEAAPTVAASWKLAATVGAGSPKGCRSKLRRGAGYKPEAQARVTLVPSLALRAW